MSLIKEEMMTKLHMEGIVNGHIFTIKGEGKGNPFLGVQDMKLCVTKGASLPFAYDILTPAFMYGNRVFTKYPANIPDYFKQTFPDGYSWERIMIYEDQGMCMATSHIRLEGNCFLYDVQFHGVNFPSCGPVMQKKILQWEPSTEKMYERDGVLRGDVNMALLLKDGGHYRCDFTTTYKAKKNVTLPEYHYVDHRIEILDHKEHYSEVDLHATAEARYSLMPIFENQVETY